MSISVNYPYVGGVFLYLLSTNADFREKLEEFSEDLKPEIDSYIKNNNCSCKNKILKFADNNKENSVVFLNSFLKEFKVEINLAKISSMFEFPDYSGTVHYITEQEWPEFVLDTKSKKARFSSFSIVKDGESLAVYFL
jgi:hypothetical protein